MTSRYGDFPIECPRCGQRTRGNLTHMRELYIDCHCQGNQFSIPLPEVFIICEKCDGNKFLHPDDENAKSMYCDKCGGTGVTTWVDIILR